MDEKGALLEYLRRCRVALLAKLDGLGEYDVRRPMTPTGTNLLGLVKHVAYVQLGYFGEVFATDGRIPALDLTPLEDDRDFFPSYNVAAVVGTDVLEQHPALADVFAQVSPLLTDEVLQQLNARVDVDGEEPADVALDWMVSEGLVDRA